MKIMIKLVQCAPDHHHLEDSLFQYMGGGGGTHTHTHTRKVLKYGHPSNEDSATVPAT